VSAAATAREPTSNSFFICDSHPRDAKFPRGQAERAQKPWQKILVGKKLEPNLSLKRGFVKVQSQFQKQGQLTQSRKYLILGRLWYLMPVTFEVRSSLCLQVIAHMEESPVNHALLGSKTAQIVSKNATDVSF
jgi:hypothetical protein